MSPAAGDVTESDMMGNPELEKLEAELEKTKDAWLRALAETENVRRRSVKDVEEAHKYGIKKLLEELIPIMDSLEQGLTVQGSDHEMVKGMRDGMVLTLQMLHKVLEKFGVTEINPLNELFNPTYHEVMLAQEKPDAAPNTILEVMQKGYMLHERVIRPARVMIAKATN